MHSMSVDQQWLQHLNVLPSPLQLWVTLWQDRNVHIIIITKYIIIVISIITVAVATVAATAAATTTTTTTKVK